MRGGKRTRRISYKVSEASAACGLSTGVLYTAIRQNQLPAYQADPRGEMLVLKKDLFAYITRHPVNQLAAQESTPKQSSDEA